MLSDCDFFSAVRGFLRANLIVRRRDFKGATFPKHSEAPYRSTPCRVQQGLKVLLSVDVEMPVSFCGRVVRILIRPVVAVV